MRASTTRFLVLSGFLAAFTLVLPGCRSASLTQPLAEAFVNQVFTPPIGLVASMMAFRQANQRWPTNYGELSVFINQSGGKFQPLPYRQVEFSPQLDGSVEICAFAPGMTNRMTLTPTQAGQGTDNRAAAVAWSYLARHKDRSPNDYEIVVVGRTDPEGYRIVEVRHKDDSEGAAPGGAGRSNSTLMRRRASLSRNSAISS